MGLYIIPNEATHAALVIIEYEDGAPDEFPVGFGTHEDCDRIARELPAVAATSGMSAKSARVSVVELHPLCVHCAQRHSVGSVERRRRDPAGRAAGRMGGGVMPGPLNDIDDLIVKARDRAEDRRKWADELVAAQNPQTPEEAKRFAAAWIVSAAEFSDNADYWRRRALEAEGEMPP